MSDSAHTLLEPTDNFVGRHIGPGPAAIAKMLTALDYASLEELISDTLPASIRSQGELDLGRSRSEHGLLCDLEALAQGNKVFRSYLGMGYHDCITPAVIQRNILEDPGWYTQYTPYQAEIAQGRLEMLLNFQTMICDLTGLPISNASLLDEATAAAEAMAMAWRCQPKGSEASTFLVADDCHPQTIAVVQTRAEALGVAVEVGPRAGFDFDAAVFGCLVQTPTTCGELVDYTPLCNRAHEGAALVTVAADPLALTLLRSPAQMGADIVVGSAQRLGVPLGYGGPHAAFFATKQAYQRQVPGRIIGISKDAQGNRALRMALQTREQHIRRHRATSNICTAQVLLAVISAAYGVYHGPEGLRSIANRIRRLSLALREGLRQRGHEVGEGPVFDTLSVKPVAVTRDQLVESAAARGINLRPLGEEFIGISLNETVRGEDLRALLEVFGALPAGGQPIEELLSSTDEELPASLARSTPFMTHPVFHQHRSETELLRYLEALKGADLSLTHSMIPLGSCTMKLNGTTEMKPVTWPQFGGLHPFAPVDQAKGYRQIFDDLERWLATLTGFDAISLQPNAGSQGEYAGLLVIRAWHRDRDEAHRRICLIPTSAHGTNPASAVMAGMTVVPVGCDDEGNIDLDDLSAKAAEHASNLAALMITYPSTHGVFEEGIREICATVHQHGGQVYMDGANMNAMVGLCKPGDIGADVCHLNLHKTFCIPHGGGGPGMGPIGVKAHLAPYLPGHPVIACGGDKAIGAIAAAPWGSPSILPISWVYIALMGAEGLTKATQVAILNANYIAQRLDPHFPILYKGASGRVAHECIIDLRAFKRSANISVDDIAKRLVDYGFHAPTMSWPVAGTMMIEPTESESLAELDRFCDAMIAIRGEIAAVESGEMDRGDNPLLNAPHTAAVVSASAWSHPYSREQAAFPAPWSRSNKFWPPVGRIDNAYGDRNLACTCPSVEELAGSA